MTNKEKALEMHKQWNGKLSVEAKCQVASAEDLAIAYTPGVAEPCRAIAKNPKEAYTYTIKSNTVAVVSDGSAVLGLGNIGALAAMPVMEGKAALFKEFGGVNAFPICLDTQDTEEIIETVVRIAPAFGGINLEDIAAPRCCLTFLFSMMISMVQPSLFLQELSTLLKLSANKKKIVK